MLGNREPVASMGPGRVPYLAAVPIVPIPPAFVLRLLPVALVFVAVLTGCEEQLRRLTGDAPAAPTGEFGSADDSLLVHDVQPGEDDYRIELSGLVPDTLSGRATFGRVVDGPTGKTMSVVRLRTGLDFGGGFFVLVPADRFPAPGTYPISVVPDSLAATSAQPGGLWVAYRRGLLFDLVSTDGTVTFTTVVDTLVAGRFDVTLAGTVALPGGSPQEGSLTARGSFRAHPEGAGFILGL